MRLRNNSKQISRLKQSYLFIEKPELLKKDWLRVFENKNPIEIEIGMGKGKFITTKAVQNPEINFIGIEKQIGAQAKTVYKSTQISKNEIKNLKLISIDAKDLLSFFKRKSIDVIYINFPDPWPKKGHFKRRLVYRDFLLIYNSLLKQGGHITFKSDQKDLYEFFLEQIKLLKGKFTLLKASTDLHSEKIPNITTEYEDKFSRQDKVIYFADVVKS